VGSIFRTADAAGVSHIILSGYTPAPVDRFLRERKDFAKVSLGAEKTVPWKRAKQLTPALKKLKKEGYKIIAVEQYKNSVSLFDYASRKFAPPAGGRRMALILGNEVKGLPKSILTQADVVVEIPMRGKKESLNVSVATGIVLFTLLKNN
jgi:tRNA G18 (ribose-2'-O)-methylase SpoU